MQIFHLYYFEKFVFWKMPKEVLENEIKNTWELTSSVIKNGNIIKDFQNGKYISNFPGSTFNHICHVRPHDSQGIDKSGKGAELPVPDQLTGLTRYTKHCFWLDRSYILSIIYD